MMEGFMRDLYGTSQQTRTLCYFLQQANESILLTHSKVVIIQ